MDVIIALAIIACTPLMVLNQRGRHLWTSSFCVAIGLRTWVGYLQADKKLPHLKPHVLEASGKFFGTEFQWDANLSYAKDFEPLMDLERVINYWRNNIYR